MNTEPRLTARQYELLQRVRKAGSCYLKGADVRVARLLEKLGLVTIEDLGEVILDERNDGERWKCSSVVPSQTENSDEDDSK